MFTHTRKIKGCSEPVERKKDEMQNNLLIT